MNAKRVSKQVLAVSSRVRTENRGNPDYAHSNGTECGLLARAIERLASPGIEGRPHEVLRRRALTALLEPYDCKFGPRTVHYLERLGDGTKQEPIDDDGRLFGFVAALAEDAKPRAKRNGKVKVNG